VRVQAAAEVAGEQTHGQGAAYKTAEVGWVGLAWWDGAQLQPVPRRIDVLESVVRGLRERKIVLLRLGFWDMKMNGRQYKVGLRQSTTSSLLAEPRADLECLVMRLFTTID
jgi:hypothetical protein